MTRINVVPVQELHPKHLVAEYREIVRVFALVRKRSKMPAIPSEYVLGAGHVTFFFDKLGYILSRYRELIAEMRNRGYSPNPVPEEDLLVGIDPAYMKGYVPTTDALRLNRERIKERMPKF